MKNTIFLVFTKDINHTVFQKDFHSCADAEQYIDNMDDNEFDKWDHVNIQEFTIQ